MANLLSANFLRLRKSRVLCGSMAAMFLYGLTRVSALYDTLQHGGSSYFPPFHFLGLAPFLLAVYSCTSNAAEFGDGAIRNKLTVGTPRPAVYLANLIDSSAAALLLCAAYVLPTWTLDWLMFHDSGVLEYPAAPTQVAVMLLTSAVAMLSYNALFTMIGMNVQGKAGGAVAIVLLAVAVYLQGRQSYGTLIMHWQDPIHWPINAFGIVWNSIFALWLPGGQAEFLSMYYEHVTPWMLMIRSFTVIIVSTAAGLLLFQRKDLK